MRLLGFAGFLAGASAAHAEEAHRIVAGAYSFSDELGGFRLLSVTGDGTVESPFVIRQELVSASPVTLTIRAERPIRAFDTSGRYANGFMHMRVELLNNSGHSWIEFEFELQEAEGVPSTFGDGLSFDQRQRDGSTIGSETFARFNRAFEPYDQLRFSQGKVDPLESAGFRFLVTDYTPRWTFYLVQDPRIPSS
ncbi:hypothetical protein [Oryzicola mucosus]|uniref:Uncharacterized protein n=1 Tax=Oryzicola mucosus TaxID=2767425 RepID=A0A8J6PQ50_9HYPH|nr:hypothetical protein [Oryzicola mucosus]MBD0415875.1 hypothetical protein [Oryzicola mucosus]